MFEILSDEDIEVICDIERRRLDAIGVIDIDEWVRLMDRAIARKAAQEILRQGNDICPHTTPDEIPQLQRECEICWQELKKLTKS